MGGDDVLLQMKQIDKHFPGTHALNKVDFSLRKGEVHALIGQNGSGKSTLMNILSGGVRMDSGQILMNGNAVVFKNPHQAIECGIAMIHQELKLVPELTVAENIFFGRFPRKHGIIDWKKLFKMGKEEIEKLSSDIDSMQKVRELSVAQQQMVEISRVLSMNVEIVIMDEPTASLSDEEVQGLFRIIRRIRSNGVSIIYISHRLDELMEIADRVTVLRDGVRIETIDCDKIVDKNQLVNLMIKVQSASFLRGEEQRKVGPVVLETQGLSLGKTLDNVQLQLHQGEVLGIAGLLGSGRTELLKTLFGVYQPSGGRIIVGGRSFATLNPQTAVGLGIAFMSEDRKNEGLLLKMSIRDNTIYASFNQFTRGGIINWAKARGRVKQLGVQLQIKMSSMDSLTGELSGGNQQKVVIAKWLCANSSIILMDEPTRGIDVGAKNEIYNLVRQLADQGKSIIFVSSELEEVQMVSDRILVLRNGNVAKELPANTSVEEMMCHVV